MPEDVDIPLGTMQELSDALGAIEEEFRLASSRTDELEEAIGAPLGRSELRDEAVDFESAWDDKRETLRRAVEEMKQRVDDTREAWTELDAELAAATETA